MSARFRLQRAGTSRAGWLWAGSIVVVDREVGFLDAAGRVRVFRVVVVANFPVVLSCCGLLDSVGAVMVSTCGVSVGGAHGTTAGESDVPLEVDQLAGVAAVRALV